jgi:hypothetical protein
VYVLDDPGSPALLSNILLSLGGFTGGGGLGGVKPLLESL